MTVLATVATAARSTPIGTDSGVENEARKQQVVPALHLVILAYGV
jgi:hypothetical protein